MGKQIDILSAKEIEQIYGLPKFTAKQRKIYFTISEAEKSLMTFYRTPITRAYFLLQLAYFKFKQQFFIFDLQVVKSDVAYLQKIYFPHQSLPTTGEISKPRRLQQQKHILKLLNYKVADKNIRADLLQRAYRLATVSAQAIFIFRDLCNWLEQERIVLPGYTVMQRHIVGKAVVEERKRLEIIVGKYLSIDFKLQLKNTLSDKTDTGVIEGTYILSWLKTEAINFNSQTIRQSIKRKMFIQELYPTAKSITEKLGISNENIRYYANLIKHYTIGELRQFKGNMLYVLLCCFLHYRYRQINDLLVEAFRYYVRKYDSKAKQIVKEYFYKYRLEAHHQLEKIPSILAILTNESIDGNTPFSVIRQQVLNLLDEEKIHLLTNYINNDLVDEVAVKWNHYQDIQRKISYNLRHIFLHLELSHIAEDNKEIIASNKFKSLLKNRKRGKPITAKEVNIDCIPKYLQRHLYIENEFQINRYELMLYQALNRQIEAGNVFVIESFNNRSLEADLIDLDYWKSNKEQILEQIALPKLLQTPTEFLAELEGVLEAKIKQVNNDIAKGENKAVKIKDKTDGVSKWQLHYPESDKPINHEMYRNLPIINIHSLLHWLEHRTDFIKEFTHVLPKNIQYKSPDINSIIACIVALGTNHGLSDMANRSDVEYNHLRRTYQNFMRQSTLSNANTAIINATAKLPFFTHYNLQENILHSSSDGQKYSTRFDTIKARYSTKYFGLEKGVSLQTLVLNHIPVNAKIIGANEHESHYVFDLLMSNLSNLKPAIHSTDSHGTNKVNFAILDCFGYRFAPRYKKFTGETENLVGFKDSSTYPKKYLIKPSRKIDKQRLIKQWDYFQRIMASLALKTTSQSNIVRKLSSFKRVNEIQSALNDYNDIVKSIFMLDYTDSANFRKNIQKALNRGEAYHRLRKNVAYAHDGKIQSNNTTEQQIWSESSRLICNAIIYYNTYLLSELLEKSIKENKTEDIEIIKGISPIAWQHINLHGLYQFQKEATKINWKEIVGKVKIKK